MKTIITGGAGFIGSNLAGELVKNCEVTIIDNLSTGKMENIRYILNNVKFINGSINDLDILKRAFSNADTVFHQAAIPSVQRSLENPIHSSEINIEGTLKVLVAARDCGVKKVVYASSSSVYGDTTILPKKEEMKPNPKSPYAVSKLAGEYYSSVFSDLYGLNVVCLRYFNVFGPRQSYNSEYSAVIPRFVTRILEGKPPIIYGDGNQTRDFTFVKDVVKANILAMNGDAKGVFNIACGKKTSLNELAEHIMNIIGNNVDPIYKNVRNGDIKDSLADISMAKERIGYQPNYDIISGLKETVKWFQKK